jgi:5-methylcytosine-specific restriction endonuclease McrA
VAWVKSDSSEKPQQQGDEVSQGRACPAHQKGPAKRRTCREISDRQRFRILVRDGFRCRSCGASPLAKPGVELHVDHVLPWSKGGETVDENLATKCKKCNLGKGNAFDS